jgi:PTS system nitrogen regulatory IIA component
MNPMPTTSDFLTVTEVATHLRLSEYAVRDMAKRGQLPAYKVGHLWRIRRQDLADWMDTNFNQKLDKK